MVPILVYTGGDQPMSKHKHPGSSHYKSRIKSLTEAVQILHNHWKKKLSQRGQVNAQTNKHRTVELTFVQSDQQDSPKKGEPVVKAVASEPKTDIGSSGGHYPGCCGIIGIYS